MLCIHPSYCFSGFLKCGCTATQFFKMYIEHVSAILFNLLTLFHKLFSKEKKRKKGEDLISSACSQKNVLERKEKSFRDLGRKSLYICLQNILPTFGKI